MCPYYFDLEEKFLERAGIKPAATTDEVFGGNDDGQGIFNTNDCNDSNGEYLSDSSYVNEDDDSNEDESSRKRRLNISNNKNKTTNSAKKQRGRKLQTRVKHLKRVVGLMDSMH